MIPVETLGRGWDWLRELASAVRQVTYKNWRFFVGADAGAAILQVQFDDEHGDRQFCRKWLLYDTMNRSEAVRTAWLAVLAAEEHEAREEFMYMGKRVMSPHVDFDKVVARGALPTAATADPR